MHYNIALKVEKYFYFHLKKLSIMEGWRWSRGTRTCRSFKYG